MTNPYAMQANPYETGYSQPNYMQPNYVQANSYQPAVTVNPSETSTPSTVGMMTLGALGGGTVGFFKNRYPIGKDGSVSDSFAKNVFEKNLKNNRPESSQKFFKQLKEILNKIDKINSPEDFKKLLNANKEIIEDQCKGISSETLIDAVNSTNLKESKKSLKESLQGIMNFELQKTKNAIKLAWNNEAKKFVKTPEFQDNKLFEIIKNTKTNVQWKKALKYGGITAGIIGALTLGYKLLTGKRNS